MITAAFEKMVLTELRRAGATGTEEVPSGTRRLSRPEIRFRASPDGRLAEFRRTGWPVLVLSSRLTLRALKRVGKGAGAESVWRSLGTACE
jgi:hypothetical protein